MSSEKVHAGRPPAARVTMRAVETGRGWLAQLGAPQEFMSLWTWLCDHGHPNHLEALDCASHERARLAEGEAGA
jgi:hypothetical protein